MVLFDRSIARRHPWLGWLLGTQLCPAIWLLIMVLLAAFFTQAVHNPTYPPLSPVAAVAAYMALACAAAGLYLLYRVTTSDPGILPRGGSLAERGKVRPLPNPQPSPLPFVFINFVFGCPSASISPWTFSVPLKPCAVLHVCLRGL